MTSNQIAYWNMIETRRANKAREAETNRSNLANEGLKAESNREIARSNLVNEGIKLQSVQETQRANIAHETETQRSNLAKETETSRSNKAAESENQRHNIAAEEENKRHNFQTELISNYDSYSKGVTAQANALKQGFLNWGLANVGALQAREEAKGSSLANDLVQLANRVTTPSLWVTSIQNAKVPGHRSIPGYKHNFD